MVLQIHNQMRLYTLHYHKFAKILREFAEKLRKLVAILRRKYCDANLQAFCEEFFLVATRLQSRRKFARNYFFRKFSLQQACFLVVKYLFIHLYQ